MRGESLGKTTVSDLLAAERDKTAAPGSEDAHTAPGNNDGETDHGPGMMPSPA